MITSKIPLSKCCGCFACGDVCTDNAITFKINNEGFYYPEIDTNKCSQCNRCIDVCPSIHSDPSGISNLFSATKYVAENKNISTIFDSSAGGIFSAFADILLMDDFYISGAIYTNNFEVKHIITNNKEETSLIRGYKYPQSNLSNYFKEIKELLDRGEKVLATGTPCQMYALKLFLNQDYDNLIIIDYKCRGVVSHKAYISYIQEFEKKYKSKIVKVSSISKEFDYSTLTHQAVMSNGKSIYESIKESLWTKTYYKSNILLRNSCIDCNFCNMCVSDITLEDYNGNYDTKGEIKHKGLGTTLVNINTDKGNNLFDKIKRKINFETTNNQTHNVTLYNCNATERTIFYKELENGNTFTDAINKVHSFNKGNNSLLYKLKKHKYSYLLFKKHIGYNPINILKFIKVNSFKSIIKGNIIYNTKNTIIDIKGELILNGKLIVGTKHIKNSKIETRLSIDNGGKLNSGDWTIGYGSDIQIFKNGELSVKGPSNINSNAIIICANKISIGKDVRIGRNVTIRDNNGEHYIDIPGYKTSSPIIIEDHVWLGEGCTILQGVKIGEGAVISARAVVSSNVPPHSIVSGNPAKVVQNDIRWKF